MSDSGSTGAHFQTNLLIPTRMRTMRVGFLSKIVPDPRIPYINLIIAMASVFIIAIVAVFIMTRPLAVIYYLVPTVFLVVGSLGLLVMFLLPYRGRSMLSTVVLLLLSKAEERLRFGTSINGEFPHIGVLDVEDDGTLHFASNNVSSNEVGVLYRVEGQIARSALPGVVNEINEARRQYLTARTPGTGEELITSIGRKDATPMMDYYHDVWSKNNQRSGDREWFASTWANIMFDYVENQIHQKDVVVNQYLILRDIDKASLAKSARLFQDEVSSTGMYAAAVLLDDKKSVVDVLSPIAMNAKGGSK